MAKGAILTGRAMNDAFYSEQKALRAAAELLALKELRVGDEHVDAVARYGDGVIAIAAKHLPTMRHEDLIGRLAHSVLVLRHHAPSSRHLVIVTSPHLSQRAIASTTVFMNEHAPDIQWVLLGDNGDVAVHAPAFGVEHTRLRQRGEKAATTAKRTTAQPFSDLNAWMLKVLLLSEVDERFWAGPRTPVRSASELAEVAHVSEPHAYRFVKTFEEMDFLRRSDDRLVIVRRAALVEAWLETARLTPRKTLPARWVVGRPADAREVFETQSGGIFGKSDGGIFGKSEGDVFGKEEVRVALAGFEACRALGVLHTESMNHEVHIGGNVRVALKRFDLEACAARDAHFTLLPATGASVFRGSVHWAPGLRCADIFQAALDVVVHPARGREQADYIIHDVLGWR